MTYEISRKYEFSAAHRIPNHPKCGKMHGHNYTVEIVLTANTLRNGMVMDFGELDLVAKPYIAALDHHYLVGDVEMGPDNKLDCMNVMETVDINAPSTTAEHLAEVIHNHIQAALGTSRITVKEVSVWETDRSKATYRR